MKMRATLLLMAIVVILDWSHACEPTLDNGKIVSMNCTGLFAMRTSNSQLTHPCDLEVNLTVCGPIEIVSNTCKKVILAGDCPELEQPIKVQVIILWVCLSLCILVCIGLLILILGIIRILKRSKSFQMNHRHLLARDEEGTRKFTYWTIMLMVLSCKMQESHCVTCVEPHSLEESRMGSSYRFWLIPGASACFSDGAVMHVTSDTSLETTLMYKTAEWRHLTWSKQACGMGDCGTREECAVWGDHGKIVQGTHKRHQYKKYCKTILRPWAFCFHMWGCWLATNEISWDENNEWDVKSIGNLDIVDDYVVSGLEDCQISIIDVPATSIRGNYLLSRGKDAKVCKSASEEGFPLNGRLGDLQIINGSDPLFDYDSFQCDLATSYSSGDCRVRASAVSVISSRCLSLPTNLDLEHLWYDGTELHSTPLAAREFKVDCKGNKTVKISDHNCHSIEVSVEGIRQEQDFMFITFKALSPNSSSVYPVGSNCHMEKVEIPCDGSIHIIKAYTYPLEDCFPSDSSFTDKTISPETPSWTWDHTDHEVFGPSGSIKSMILYAAGVLAILLVIKMICSK